MKVFLVVLFMDQGAPAVVEGYLPREQVDLEACEGHADFLRAYANEVPEAMPPLYSVSCVEAADMFEAAGKAAKLGTPL